MIGDPDLEKTFENIQIAVDEGIDIVELGIPIAEPILDSRIMYESMNRALNYSNDLSSYLIALQSIRRKFPSVAFEVMVYKDTVSNIGFDKFFKGLSDTEMDAVLVADGVLHGQEYLDKVDTSLKNANCIPIRFVPHPYDPAQLPDLKSNGNGFIVVQTKTDRQGKRDSVLSTNKVTLDSIRSFGVVTPLVMAYGIKTPKDIEVCMKLGADGVLIGSSVLDAAYKYSRDEFVNLLKAYRKAAK